MWSIQVKAYTWLVRLRQASKVVHLGLFSSLLVVERSSIVHLLLI